MVYDTSVREKHKALSSPLLFSFGAALSLSLEGSNHLEAKEEV